MAELVQKRRRRSAAAEQIDNRDRTKENEPEEYVGPDPKKITEDRLIPSGSTLVNCACSDNPKGAFALGSINTIPGKSASGKTVLMLTMLACCAVDPKFKEYEFIYDDGEQSLSFDLDYLFPPLAPKDPEDLTSGRLKAPNYDDGEPVPSETIQDFKGNILIKCKQRKPFIWVLDSLDSLSSDEEMEREYKNAIKNAKSAEAVTELKGSYKAEKAKHIGEALRMINGNIKRTDSALFIIQQTRQRFKSGFGQTDWVTSGGDAPFFYSFHQLYLNSIKSITDEAMNLKHKIGSMAQIEVIKNKLTGKKRKSGVVIPIYESYGLHDVESCIDFLKLTEHWASDTKGITAKEFDIKKSKDNLIEYIEDNNLQDALQDIVGSVWKKVEKMLMIKTPRRF